MPNHEFCLFDECFVPQQALAQLAQSLPTPFYLYDEAGLRHSAQRIARAFSWSSGHRQFFPLRLTPNPAVLSLLREEGCGVQCCSLAELLLAQRCGFSGEDLIFAPLFPTAAELDVLEQLDGTLLLDSEAAAAVCMARENLPQRVLLRYNPGGKFVVRTQTLGRMERSKLGIPQQRLFDVAAALQKRGVSWIGLQTDPAKQTMELDYFAAVARMLHELAVLMKNRTGITAAALHLGGDLGIGFLPEQENPDILVMGERTRIQVQALCGERSIPIHTNIGRLLTGPNAIMVSRVLAVQKTHRNFVVLDATVGTFMRATQGACHHVSVVGKTQNTGRVYCDVVGRVPEVDARFAERRMLPEPVPGDCCVIHDAGFSGSAIESAYGGTPRCAEYLYRTDGTVIQIRPAQTAEDLLKVW